MAPQLLMKRMVKERLQLEQEKENCEARRLLLEARDIFADPDSKFQMYAFSTTKTYSVSPLTSSLQRTRFFTTSLFNYKSKYPTHFRQYHPASPSSNTTEGTFIRSLMPLAMSVSRYSLQAV